MVAMETKTEFDKSAIQTQQKKIIALISQSFLKSNLLIYHLTTFHNAPEGCILFCKSYYANDPSF
jgi:hypothetical protein